MAKTIDGEICKYLANLTATSDVWAQFVSTPLVDGTNVKAWVEPATATSCITVIPYGGEQPNIDRYRQGAAVQIRIKSKSVKRSTRTAQAIINNLHANDHVCASTPGKVFAIQSAPTGLGYLDGGEYYVTVANFMVKYVKL